jgi:YD repeat-containing protein
MKRISIVFIILPCCLYVAGQQKLEANKYANQSLITASPSATMLGVFGHTPVSYFTGTPDINIPLYEAAYKELSIDLSLRYHQAFGNKPDAFPGSTGNGWLLTTGGAITRVSRGATPHNFADGIIIPTNFNPTADPGWSSNATMQNYLSTQTVFFDENGRYDEYTYSFGGNSGKFYIDHTDAFRIKTAQGEDLLIEKVPADKEFIMPAEVQGPLSCLATTAAYTNIVKQKDFVYKFTITDSRGIKYTFGGTKESIELVRPGMPYAAFDLKDENTVPVSWYLTSVQSPNGYRIDLIYKRDKFYITNEISVNSRIITPAKFAGTDNAPKAKGIKSTLYHPCYIDSIITPVSTVKFNWSIADMQLGYNFTISNPPLSSGCASLVQDYFSEFYFCKYPEIKDAPITGRFPNKLDGFIVFNSDGLRKKAVEFNYTNSTTTRLKLLSVKIKGDKDTDQNLPVYSFEYNTMPLPEYLSFKTDDYGFYNGANPYITSNDPSYYYNLFPNATTRQAYLESRKPNINYTQAEILKKITYPTGGSTEYEYENNMYGRIAKFWPASIIENATGAEYTGGLRIKSITSYDYGAHLAGKKQYFYQVNYATGGTASSGILSFEPIHFAYFNGTVTPPANYRGSSYFSGPMTFTQYSTDPLNAASHKGNHITYSEVAEVNLDGSFTVFKYKNYDNGYHDRPAENMVCDNSNVGDFWKADEMNSMEIERGQLLSEELYSSTKSLRRNTVFVYDDNINRFNEHIRRVKLIPNPIFSVNYRSLRYTASLIYTYYPFLKTKTTTSYEDGNALANITNYTFNGQNRLLTSQSTVNSKNQHILVSNKYPHDFPSDPVSVEMKGKHIIAPVIETSTTISGTQANLVRTNFFSPSYNVYVPKEIKVQNASSPMETRQQFHQYDAKGNLLEQQKTDDIKESYQWGYKDQFPVAKIVNAANNTSTNFMLAPQNQFLSVPGSSASVNLVSAGTGNIVLSINIVAGNFYALKYTLSGPTVRTGTLCTSSNVQCPNPQTVTFNNMPAGSYTLSVTLYTGSSENKGVTITYPVAQNIAPTGAKEFFYDGFEEGTNSNVLSGASNTGKKYWNANYTVSFAPPNSRNYIIQWWNLSGGKWNFNQQAFASNMMLTGPVDDVRIFPLDAQMTTYTYEPLIGMTSQTDATGKATYYEYDGNGRLMLIRDQDKNVIKKIGYNYSGQPETNDIFYNEPQSASFTRSCPSGYSGSTVTYTVAAGLYSGNTLAIANTQARAALNANGPGYANTNGVCIPFIVINGYNSKANDYRLKLTNNATGTVYNFELTGNTSTSRYLGQVPHGTYTVQFQPFPQPVQSATYNINGITISGGSSATFNNVSITSASTASMY